MFKKTFLLIFFVFVISHFLFVLSDISLSENNLYYSDLNNNGKIDNLEIEFNKTLSGNINFSKLFLYSNTGGLSSSKLDGVSGNNIFSGFYLSGNILGINLVEQDNSSTGLIINNLTSSHLRLKTNAGVGIYDDLGNEIKLLYTTSFNNYKNVYFKENIINTGNEENTNTGSIETGTGNLENTQTGSIETGTGELSNSGTLSESGSLENSGTLINTGVILPNFTIKLLFQNPTYLSEKNQEISEYNCLTSETDCKVNFNLNGDFGSGLITIPNTKYNCEWNFGFAEFIEEKYKCNPNTITFPEGTYEINYKISEIANPNNFVLKNLKIINSGYKEPENIKTVYIGGGGGGITIVNYMYIDTPKIIIQSGLDENNNCKKDDCNLNLSYEPKNSKEACLWFFPGGSFDIGTDKKCNPGYIKYPLGNFKATLRVYEAGNEGNYKENFIEFKNLKKDFENINIEENTKEIGNKPVSKIILEGTVGKNKSLSNNYLTCYGSECSVNFNGEKSYSLDGLDLDYLWDFGNGTSGTGVNPKSIIYKIGEYKIILKVIDENGLFGEDDFFVKVIENEDLKENNEKKDFINLQNYTLKISKVIPNPTGVDYAEYIEITNTGSGEINLNNCELDDKINGGSKPFKIQKDIILNSGKSIKFFKLDTNINLNNTSPDEVNLVCNGDLIDNLKWDFNIPEGFSVYRNNNKIEIIEENPIKVKDLITQNLENMKTGTGLNTTKIKEIINKTFTQKIKKQKSGIKIYGKTFPNTIIIIELNKKIQETSFLFLKTFASENNYFETISDEKGNYEINLDKVDLGEFEVKSYLKVDENHSVKLDNISNFDIDNDYLEYINFSKEVKISKKSKPLEKLKSNITLQKLAKSIGVSGNKIICKNAEECNINFDGRNSTGDIKRYFWDFGNGISSIKSNPASIKFKTGKYIVSLKISDLQDEDISYFLVEIEGKIKKENISQNNLNKKELLKIEKINILPVTYADNGEQNKDLTKNILLSFFTFSLFLILSFIILKKEKII
ncbi:MAG: PKD domain-containing protein [Candidatus Gracilibacteria bacterium]|nr:PKD domain-containing protein [Candidatus Gracilibacteria bacterium]